MERYEQALIHYDQSLALDPNWVDAWIGRGVVKDVQERLPEAVKDLEMAIRISPDTPFRQGTASWWRFNPTNDNDSHLE